MTEPSGKTHWLRRFIEGVAGLIVLATVFVGAFYGITSWVDERIRTVVTDEAYVRRIAGEVRPSAIFDERGTILVDQEAMRYLESIQPLGQNDGMATNFPATIIVSPKQYLAHAPLVTCLDPVNVAIVAERGKKFDWVYTLNVGIWTVSPSYRFRIEILQ